MPGQDLLVLFITGEENFNENNADKKNSISSLTRLLWENMYLSHVSAKCLKFLPEISPKRVKKVRRLNVRNVLQVMYYLTYADHFDEDKGNQKY